VTECCARAGVLVMSKSRTLVGCHQTGAIAGPEFECLPSTQEDTWTRGNQVFFREARFSKGPWALCVEVAVGPQLYVVVVVVTCKHLGD
jgi:hypothetical protein